MPELPPFPVDPGTLDAIEEAVRTVVPDEHAAAYDSDELPATFAPLTLDQLLDQLAGRHEDGVPGEPESGMVMHTIPATYSRDDVILALITEVRELRAAVERWSHAWATAADQIASSWPEAPA